MNQEVIDFLGREKVCSLATLIDGAPYSSAMHFSYNADPLKLYFSTESNSKKCKSIVAGRETQASVVIGFSESEWLTLQMVGDIKIVSAGDFDEVKKNHFERHPESEKYFSESTIFLEFIVSWWKYTDFKSRPPTIYSSP